MSGNNNSGRKRWAKYQDADSNGAGGLPEHMLRFNNDARGYTPNAGEQDGEGKYGNLAAACIADNSFKAARFYRRDPGYTYTTWVEDFDGGVILAEPAERRAELEAQMPTYRPPRHPRACPSCHLTTCAGPGHHELADIQDFQQRARTPHRQAGDYNRHTHDYSIP